MGIKATSLQVSLRRDAQSPRDVYRAFQSITSGLMEKCGRDHLRLVLACNVEILNNVQATILVQHGDPMSWFKYQELKPLRKRFQVVRQRK
jgi:hypothetical protein